MVWRASENVGQRIEVIRHRQDQIKTKMQTLLHGQLLIDFN